MGTMPFQQGQRRIGTMFNAGEQTAAACFSPQTRAERGEFDQLASASSIARRLSSVEYLGLGKHADGSRRSPCSTVWRNVTSYYQALPRNVRDHVLLSYAAALVTGEPLTRVALKFLIAK